MDKNFNVKFIENDCFFNNILMIQTIKMFCLNKTNIFLQTLEVGKLQFLLPPM